MQRRVAACGIAPPRAEDYCVIRIDRRVTPRPIGRIPLPPPASKASRIPHYLCGFRLFRHRDNSIRVCRIYRDGTDT
tara:strand:+ start:312 stop:542 length:231 start_codon:yes stop_codon:yes gene_type:complete